MSNQNLSFLNIWHVIHFLQKTGDIWDKNVVFLFIILYNNAVYYGGAVPSEPSNGTEFLSKVNTKIFNGGFFMKAKRLLSILLAVTVVLSCCVAGFVFAPSASAAVSEYNEYAKMLEAIKPENNYGLTSTVNEGKILQAWNWSYANVIANLEKVAEQGFTTIQVSPPNEIKLATKGIHVIEADGSNGWWMYYQPAGFQLNESTDNALGTKAEFVKMCEEANKIGVKIIADAVINHMGTYEKHDGTDANLDNDSDPMHHVTDRAWEFEKEILEAKAFHSPWVNMTYKENYPQFSYKEIEEDLTQHCTSRLPDLDTSTKVVQDAIYDYMEELILAGADGFRFDAAKHIETSHDTYYASDFWEQTLLKLRADYPDEEIYAYGEILNKCGDGRPFSEYTELMDVTDSSSYWGIKDAVCSGGSNSIPYYPNSNFTKENVIQWNESHDTYIDGSTTSLNVQQRNQIWACTAARQTITGVYFARPDDATTTNPCKNILIGEARITSWALPEVAAVNQFDNYFGDADEYNSVQNRVTMIERGGKGATLVNLGGTSRTISLKAHTLAEGTYTDSITGNQFTVANGTLTGSIGSTGIACIYYSMDNEPQEPTKPVIDDIWDIEITSELFPTTDGFNTVVYSASSDSNWDTAYIYAWNDDGVELAPWPGVPMKFARQNQFEQNQFVGYIESQYNHYIISDGTDTNQTVDLDVSSNVGMYMDMKVNGKWTVGYWEPAFYEVDLSGTDPTIPDPQPSTSVETQPSTPVETQPSTPVETQPSTPVVPEGDLLADVNGDKEVNIKDATLIQKAVAHMTVENFLEDLADADENGSIDIKDATAVQKWAANKLPNSNIGKPVA